MLAQNGSHESYQTQPESRARKKRNSLIPMSTSSASSSFRKQPTRKLSKTQPSPKTSDYQTRSTTPSTDPRPGRYPTSSSGASLVPPSSMRTPSLVSGSSIASTFESPRSNVLRRKPSTIAKFVAERSEASTMHDEPTADDSVLGISMPVMHVTSAAHNLDRHTPQLYQTERMHWSTSQPISLSSLGITSADTPSTRFTGSPFSHIEAPSSRSSVSPLGFPLARQYAGKEPQSAVRHHQMTSIPVQSQPDVRQRSSQITATGKLVQIRPSETLLASSELTSQPNKRASQAISSTQAAKAVSVPPELAHLSDHSRSRQSYAAPTQMSRFQQSQLPQRNSSLVDSYNNDGIVSPPPKHVRTGSRGSIASSSSQSLRNRFGLSSRALSKLSLQAHDNAIAEPASSVEAGKSKMRIAQSSSDIASVEQHVQKTSRFGFLTRKSKTTSVQPAEKPTREPRKGPAAGTGHERYGKFGIRGRSGSNTTTSDTRSPSTSSQKSSFSDRFTKRKDSAGTQATDDMDEFLRERLKPKVLRGSGSNFSAITSPSVISINDDAPFEGLSRMSTSQSQSCDAVSVTSGVIDLPLQPTTSLAGLSREATPHPIQHPVQASLEQPPVAYHSELPSNASTTSLKRQDAEEGLWMRPLEPVKKQPSRWNFLQRVRSSPLKSNASKPAVFGEQSPDNKQSRFDNAAHYALLDAVEPVTLEEVEKLVASPTKTGNASGSSTARSSVGQVPHDARHETLLPSPPSLGSLVARELSPVACAISPIDRSIAQRSTSKHQTGDDPARTVSPVAHEPKVELAKKDVLKTPDLSAAIESPRAPRLSPVGRIPRVKSGRDRDRQLPNASFSRPFVSTHSRPTVKPPGALYSQIREVASPTPDMQESLSTTLSPADSVLTDQKIIEAFPSSNERPPATSYPGFSMFSFPSRKNSEFSYSSSSETASYMAFAYNNPFEQEDVWHEYNDLMDEVSVDYSLKPSRRSSTNCSSQSAAVNTSLPHFKDRAIFVPKNPVSPPPEQALPAIPRNQSFKKSMSLDRCNAGSPAKKQKQGGSDSMSSSRDSQISSRSLSYPDGNVRSSHTSFSSGADFVRRSRISMISLDDGRRSGVHPAVNVNFDALMTSKWLSFGRVLFSPAHNETRFADDPRILILDGLSDEWSYFVALTYPQATVYNLELTSRQESRKSQSQSLSNHRKIYHAAVGAPLPFPKGFFTAAVFRFPVATTDHAYHTAIAEFKRVLRPGGHLEISVLDIDLRAMGNLARKTVRGLKTRMQQRQESISLRTLSDFMVQAVGKRGFEEIQRCVVGVPVISRAIKDGQTRPFPMVGGSNSTSLSAIKDRNDVVRQQTVDALSGLAEVCEEQENDDKMTRTVARVGRWWYSMCYERAVPKSDQSIWKDDALLQECYDNGTSFQMLMCHAQKPVQIRRHTRSV